jgi:predicted nuclease with TOPRIM domain
VEAQQEEKKRLRAQIETSLKPEIIALQKTLQTIEEERSRLEARADWESENRSRLKQFKPGLLKSSVHRSRADLNASKEQRSPALSQSDSREVL